MTAVSRYGTTCASTRRLRGLVTRDLQAMATPAAEQDDDITDDEASFPLTFAPEVEEAIASVIVEVPTRGDEVDV